MFVIPAEKLIDTISAWNSRMVQFEFWSRFAFPGLPISVEVLVVISQDA